MEFSTSPLTARTASYPQPGAGHLIARKASSSAVRKGTEYISDELQLWAEQQSIRVEYTQPGNLQKFSCVESFDHTVHYDWLTKYELDTLAEVHYFAT